MHFVSLSPLTILETIRSKFSSSKFDCYQQILIEVKELISIQESSMKTFFGAFIEANDKRYDNLVKEILDVRANFEHTQAQL